jgi:stage V sporulation protein SpoVS
VGHFQTDLLPNLDDGTKREHCHERPVNTEKLMPADAAPNPQADADRLEAATDQAIAACGGDVRDAVKALIVANEFLETEVCELMQAVSHAYVRGRFKTYTG